MTAKEPRLSASARYYLEILSRGPRRYSASNYQIKVLARRGLASSAAETGSGDAVWTITDAGRAVLNSYRAAHSGEVSAR